MSTGLLKKVMAVGRELAHWAFVLVLIAAVVIFIAVSRRSRDQAYDSEATVTANRVQSATATAEAARAAQVRETPVSLPSPGPVPTPTPSPHPLPTPTRTPRPTPKSTPTPVPTAAPVQTPVPTALPTPLLAATSTPAPTPTPTPGPTPTTGPTATPTLAPTSAPAPTPSSTPTAEPTDVPTPTPTRTPIPLTTPTPVPAIAGNLHPFAPPGKAALNAHRSEGALTTGNLVIDDVTYIDWYVRNEGPLPVTRRFFTDVYLDGMFVQRWSTRELESGSYIGVADWSRLTEEFNITPGDHTLRLVADATDLVVETDETDNVFERTFTWGGTATTPAASAKHSNLVPSPATDRVAALIASPYADATGSNALTADARTFVTWGLRNAGLASIANVSVHLYFDDIFVESWVINGLLADSGAELVAWDDLSRIVSIAPGTHILRLVVDPGGLVVESDETDNLFEARLSWASGPPPPAEPAPTPQPARPLPTQPSRANLAPALLYGWDAAIVAKSYAAEGADAEGFDGPLSVEQPAFLSVMLRNGSPVATGGDFDVELFLDGESISVLSFNGTLDDAGSWWSDTFQLPAGSVSAGTHRIRMMVDSGGAVNEADEVDNVLQRTFEWLPGPVPAPAPPVAYTEPEVDGLLARLPDLLLVAEHLGGPDAAEADWTPAVLDVASAAYYLVTGVSLGDERLVIEILPGEEYDARHRDRCFSRHVAESPEEYPTSMARCTEKGESSAGLTLQAEGEILITVRQEETPVGVLNTLFHELGHARQRFLAPDQSEGVQSSALDGLQEAEAQVFEAVMWRTLEDRLGGRFLSYPAFALMEEYARSLIDTQVEEAASGEEHALGYVLLWLAALRDPASLGLGGELRESGWLSTETAKEFYDYLLSIAPGSASGWADSLLNESEPFLAEYRTIALSRLVRDLSPSGEGHPALRKVALLAP